jgi:hypothetical protein
MIKEYHAGVFYYRIIATADQILNLFQTVLGFCTKTNHFEQTTCSAGSASRLQALQCKAVVSSIFSLFGQIFGTTLCNQVGFLSNLNFHMLFHSFFSFCIGLFSVF